MRTVSRFLSLGVILASLVFVTTAFNPAPTESAQGLAPEYCDAVCGSPGTMPRDYPCTLRNGWPPGNVVNCGWWYDHMLEDDF